MNLAELEAKLKGGAISDLLLPGFIDQDETPPRFRAMPQALYLDCDGLLVELRTIETTGTMSLSWADAIRPGPELDEDMPAAVTSLRQQLLNDADGTNALKSIRIFDLSVVDDQLRCGALQLDLSNGQPLFIDPTYHFGMRIGGAELRVIWENNRSAAAKEHVIELSGS